MKNGRCRMHGGKSTGPRTPEGKERSRRANWKHGQYSQERLAQNRYYRSLLRMLRARGRQIARDIKRLKREQPVPLTGGLEGPIPRLFGGETVALESAPDTPPAED